MLKQDKVNIITLGCSKNIVDTEVLMKQLNSNNMPLVKDVEDADVVVINTCGFIHDAKNESIQTILQAVELKKLKKIKKIIVMGCLSERYSTVLKVEIPEVDNYFGTNKIDKVVRALNCDYKYELLGERILTTPKHFAYIKISEGCNQSCSFCAIPLMRGKLISKPIEKIVDEARWLVSIGVKEVILIAQDTTSYGVDLYGERKLTSLLEVLSSINGIEWIRIMYAYPATFPKGVLDAMVNNPKICRYIDLPIQHISDPVLKSMQRGTSARSIYKLIAEIRKKVPDISLRTTLIVGYPNEGEKEFQQLLKFVEDVEFDRLGVFTYSQEDGTKAYNLGDPIPFDVKELRQKIIMETQQEISSKKNQNYLDKNIKVIIDSKDGEIAIGRSEKDAPDIDNEVTIHSAAKFEIGNFYDVRIVDVDAYDLFATAESVYSNL